MCLLQLSENVLVYWPHRGERGLTERVLWVNMPQDVVVMIVVDQPRGMPFVRSYAEMKEALARKEAVIQTKDPWAKYRSEETTSTEYKAIMEARWEAIRPLVESVPEILFKQTRGRLVAQRAEALGKKSVRNKGVDVFYKWLSWYWQRGQTQYALLPNWEACGKTAPETPRGRPPKAGFVLGPTDVANILEIAKTCLWVPEPERKSWGEAYQELKERFYQKGKKRVKGKIEVEIKDEAEIPSFAQFRYQVEKAIRSRRLKVLKEKYGEKGFALQVRALTGNSKSLAQYPGDIYALDATMGDLYVRSAITGDVLERLTLYIVQDWFTQMIVGFYVGFGKESYLGYALALDNAIRNKVELGKEYGFPISEGEWPCQGKPAKLYSDRGPLKGPKANSMAEALNIGLLTAAAGRPDWKGALEQCFRKINKDLLHLLPGAVRTGRKRGEPDRRVESRLTIHDVRKLVIDAILQFNRHHVLKSYPLSEEMLKSKVPRRPMDIWNWGTNYRGGPQYVDPVYARLQLLPGARATVTGMGLKIGELYYNLPDSKNEGWLEWARAKKNGKAATQYVDVAYDPRNISVVYLRHEGVQGLEACHLTDHCRSFRHRDIWEVSAELARRKAEEKAFEVVASRDLASVHARRQEVVDEAEKRLKKQQGGKKQPTRANNLREATDRERACVHREETRNFLPVPKPEQSAGPVLPTPNTKPATGIDYERLMEEEDD